MIWSQPRDPTELTIGEVFTQPALPGEVPGFLLPADALSQSGDQRFNPSQVLWGMWRFWGVDRNIVLGTTLGTKVVQSGYFGTNEPLVAPGTFWTRILVPYQQADTFIIPSTNLVQQGLAVDLATPVELTQMMRAAQR